MQLEFTDNRSAEERQRSRAHMMRDVTWIETDGAGGIHMHLGQHQMITIPQDTLSRIIELADNVDGEG